MKREMITNYLVVDDDQINNMICRKIIQKTILGSEVQTFTDPDTALIYIKSSFSRKEAPKTIVFLDINMPAITGWEFLDSFERFDTRVKESLVIFMLSSSVDPNDRQRALNNPNVTGYVEKPLTIEKVLDLLEGVEKWPQNRKAC